MKKEPELTLMQEAFMHHYLGEAEFNATKAAIMAGYSRKGAKSAGYSLLEKDHIKQRIDKERNARTRRLRLSADAVLMKIASVGHYDPRKMFDDNGAMLPIKSLDEDEASAIHGFEVTEITDSDGNVIGVSKKVRLADRLPALDKIARHLGLYERDNQRTVKGEIAMLVEAVQDLDPFRPALDDEGDDLAA